MFQQGVKCYRGKPVGVLQRVWGSAKVVRCYRGGLECCKEKPGVLQKDWDFGGDP